MSRPNLFLIGLMFAAGLINLATVLGPELGFDALWYHLTLAKLYLLHGGIYHVPGGLQYYSEMPRLGEILYTILLPKLGILGPHLLSWGAGIGSAFIVYKLSRRYLTVHYSLLTTMLFYITPLVGWQSGSSYIDLLRTFFEVLAVYFLIDKKPLWTGLTIGLAVSTKTLALGSVGLLTLLIAVSYRDWKKLAMFLLPVSLISLPWFLSAYLNTGYPFYPLGTGILDSTHTLTFRLQNIVADFWKINLYSDDPFTPIYLIALPFFISHFRALWSKYHLLILYVLGSYLLWWLTPRTGGGRFLLPYLPVWSVIVTLTLSSLKEKNIRRCLWGAAVILAIVNLGYRTLATARLTPYLLGKETAESYLCSRLDFHTRVFVDCDGWFSKNISANDLVYIAGSHNLYYANFPFVHETWYDGQLANYLLTQNETLDQALANGGSLVKYHWFAGVWSPVYNNSLTGVTVYKLFTE